MIVKQYEVGNFAVFCYLIGDEETKEGLFIDPADETDRLIAEAKSHGIDKIKYIVNTHSHVDHVMGNAAMVKKTGAKIIIHEEDAPYLVRTPPDLLTMFSATPSPSADILVKDGDVIQMGQVETQSDPYPRTFSRRDGPLHGWNGLHRRHPLCGRSRKDGFPWKFMG